MLTEVKAQLGRALFGRATRKGVDLSRLRLVPDSLTWPLRREGVDPIPQLAKVRENEPVHKLTNVFGINVWLVTGHAESRAVLSDTTSYSNDIRPLMGRRGSSTDGDIGGLGFTDPPEHTRLRRLLTPEFTMRRLERLRPRIAEIVDDRLDALEASGPVADIVSTFAFPIPFQVICELLGLPADDRKAFRELGSARFDVSYGGVGALGAVSESRKFLMDATRRQRANPGDGLIGRIIADHGDEISDYDLAGLADGVFTGGFETTVSMLSLGTLALLREREHYVGVADGSLPIERVVEELLRHLSVVQVAFPRFARQDMELFGQQVRSGDVVVCSLSGSNRDDRLGPGMDHFDAGRVPVSHFAFGHGFHRCVGAELARMELRAAYPALVHRFPNMSLAVPPEELAFRDLSIVYGLDALPVRLG